jgi:predicted MPP superfamily phosphohydrolase
MKIITISDIHGRSNWKDIADISKLLKLDNSKPEYDKYIFLGDYVDSYNETDAVILFNLKLIIEFKHKYPNHVILLLGNHDLQYMFSTELHGCSGYRPSMYQELHNLFNDNKHLFQPIYQIDNYIFSHAGITTVWLNILKLHKSLEDNSISEYITSLFDEYYHRLFDVGRSRGGYNKVGGIFWADFSETTAYVLPNYHQIVGHTPMETSPYTHFSKLDDNSSITYIDDNNTGTYELEI